MTDAWIDQATAWAAGHPEWIALALFATALLESLAIAGLIIPGVAFLFAFAALAGQANLPLAEVLALAATGAAIGDISSFIIGRVLSGRLLSVWPFSRYPGMIAKGEIFFATHGGKSVIIGRFIGPIRPVLPLVAGALHMPPTRFVGFNLLSVLPWALLYILPGYLVGSALAEELALPPHFYPTLMTGAILLAAAYYVVLGLRLGLAPQGNAYHWIETRMARYDRSHRFWRLFTNERPARQGEFPLASIALSLLSLAAFLIITALVSVSAEFEHWNQSVQAWFGAVRHPIMDPAMILITKLADPPVLAAGTVLMAFTLGFRGYYAASLHIAVAMAVTAVAVTALKAGVGIDRPDLVARPPSSGGFPSGHTAGITTLVTLLACFVAGEYRQHRRWQSYVLLSLPIIPVAVSRLYLGVHWLTDVMGGVLLGLAITGATRASFSRYDRVPLSMDALSWLAVGVWMLWTVGYLLMTWDASVLRYALLP
ncbi:MAG: bifunctional DedA family/phosphatase PAP2 family protein [Pseudomonadota bacterium]|nr:bifunctional DedA family/phosphatase PAP2 family protein [Pseudomonadota bacterium]